MSEGYFEDGMNLKTDVELLKKDLHSLYKVVDKLDVTIDKLSEVTVSLDKMISLQQTQLEQQDKDDKVIMEKIESLNSRILKIENSKWFIIGIAAAVGFILAQIPIAIKLLS